MDAHSDLCFLRAVDLVRLIRAGTVSAREVVEAQSPEIAAHPNWVPVVEKGSADQRLAKADFRNVVTTDADVRKYLKAIHRTLKENSD